MVVTLAPRKHASVDSFVSILNLAVIPAGQTSYQMGFASLDLCVSAWQAQCWPGAHLLAFMYSLGACIRQHYEPGFCTLSIRML